MKTTTAGLSIGPALLLGLSAGAIALPSLAQTPSADIGTADVAGAGPAPAATANTAPTVAPSSTPLDVTQPTSVIGPNFIQHNILPTQNYDEIIKFSPSVQNIAPAGAGLQQNFQETIRGFQYTQFNTTLDGIVLPGLPTNLAPQSAAYIQAHDINSVQVDRGPGSASTLGYATFGGTVSIMSKSPSNTVSFNPYASFGSWGTKLAGMEVDTGTLADLGGARGFIDVQREEGRGYLTGTGTERRNVLAKIEVPVGDSTLLTFFTNVDNERTHTPYGATLQQIQTYGPNYALNQNNRSQNFTGYDVDVYTTDFDYVGIKSDLGAGWNLDDKIYTNAYNKRGVRGSDVGGSTPNLNGKYFINGQPVTLTNDVPGLPNRSNFRDWGNIIRVTKDTSIGQLRAGFWADYIAFSSSRYTADLTLGDIPYTTTAGGNPMQFSYRTSLTTMQPYIEWALTPIPGLVVTPGLRYTTNERRLNAAINQGTKLPAKEDVVYDAFQPSIDARYSVRPDLSVYGQIARGFLAPPINVLQTTAVNSGLSPQTTVNYQVGTSYKTDALSLSADLYYIDFQNRIAVQSVAGTNYYSNGGGAIYKGVELEGTARILPEVFFYANGTLNDAFYTTQHVQLAGSPRSTAAVGPIFQNERMFASLLAKYIGPQYGLDTGAQGLQNSLPLKGYTDVDFAIGYTLQVFNGRKINARLNISNLFDDHSLINVTGTTAAGAGLYYTDPGRSVFVTLSSTL
jgi:iron complex outermembrane recepter protein